VDSVGTQTRLEEEVRDLRHLMHQRRHLDEQIESALDRLLAHAAGALGTRHVEELILSASSWAVGRSLGDIRLRSSTGVTAAAITRGEEEHFSPPPDMLLQAGDVLTIVGSDGARTRAKELLAAATAPSVQG